MASSDKFDYFSASTANPVGKYTQPKAYSVPAMSGEYEMKVEKMRISVGNIVKDVQQKEEDSTTVRGGKAQTKGRIARGPMA